MTISAKLTLAFVFCASVIAAFVFGVLSTLDRQQAQIDGLNVVAQESADHMSLAISSSRSDMYAFLTTRDPALAKKARDHLDEFDDSMVRFQQTEASLAYEDDSEQSLIRQAQDARNVLEPTSSRLEAQFTGNLPISSQLSAYEQAAAAAQNAADKLAEHESAEAMEKRAELVTTARWIRLWLLLTGVGAFGLAAAMTGFTAFWVTKPIHRLTRAIEKVSAGELESTYSSSKKDEIGDLSRAFNDMQARLKSAIDGMNDEFEERHRTETELADTNSRLTDSVHQLERSTERDTLMSEMGDFIQSAIKPDEAYAIITTYAGKILPGASGRLCILDTDGEMVRTVATFGTKRVGRPAYHRDECWALRTGRTNVSENPATDVRCGHLQKGDESYLCAPLSARGETVGVLSVTCPGPASCSTDEPHVVTSIAERGALAIADLRLRAVLEEQSIRDALTGLFNRRFLEEWLPREVERAKRESKSLGVVMIDLDNLKRINDSFGHETGDNTLREVGMFLRESIRSGDVALRYGGDEFALVFPNASRDDSHARSESLRESWTSRAEAAGTAAEMSTLSFGVAAYPVDGQTCGDLFAAADAALYRAKRDGRNRVVSGPTPT